MIITLWIEHLSSAYGEGRKTCVVLRQYSDFGGEEGRKTSLRRYLDFGEEKSSKTCKASVSDLESRTEEGEDGRKSRAEGGEVCIHHRTSLCALNVTFGQLEYSNERWYLVWHDDVCM